MLTYSHAKPQTTEAYAAKFLRGQAKQEYDALFTALREKAPGQKLTLTATVRAIGIKQFSGSAVQALVFLDQSSTRAGEKTSTVAAAQLSVTAAKVGGA